MQQQTRTGGFASMEVEKQREIARKGGMAAHRKGTAHEFTTEEARNAGRKGGQQVSVNRNHMIEIGRLGGRRSAERRRNRTRSSHDAMPAQVNSSSDEGSMRQQGADAPSMEQHRGTNMPQPQERGANPGEES